MDREIGVQVEAFEQEMRSGLEDVFGWDGTARPEEVSTIERFLAYHRRAANRMRTILMLLVRRPDILSGHPKLLEQAKDMHSGIENGTIPKPNWWDLFKDGPKQP